MSESSQRLARITRVSRTIAVICGVLALLLPSGLAVYVFGFSKSLAQHPQVIQLGFSGEAFSLAAQAALLAAMLISSLPALWALYHLRRLFQRYATGSVFTVEAAGRLKAVALALLAMVFVRPFSGMLISLAISIDLPEGQRKLAIAFGSNEVWLGLAGVMVLVIAWVIGEAAALAEENQSFV